MDSGRASLVAMAALVLVVELRCFVWVVSVIEGVLAVANDCMQAHSLVLTRYLGYLVLLHFLGESRNKIVCYVIA